MCTIAPYVCGVRVYCSWSRWSAYVYVYVCVYASDGGRGHWRYFLFDGVWIIWQKEKNGFSTFCVWILIGDLAASIEKIIIFHCTKWAFVLCQRIRGLSNWLFLFLTPGQLLLFIKTLLCPSKFQWEQVTKPSGAESLIVPSETPSLLFPYSLPSIAVPSIYFSFTNNPHCFLHTFLTEESSDAAALDGHRHQQSVYSY